MRRSFDLAGLSTQSVVALSSLDANKWRPLLARDWPTRPTADASPSDTRTGPLRQRQKRLTKADVDAMEARYADGATVRELAQEFGCHKQTVAQHLRARGVELGYRIAQPEDVEQFIQLYASGLSLVKVAERTGFSEKTVMNRLREEGVQLRDVHGRPRV